MILVGAILQLNVKSNISTDSFRNLMLPLWCSPHNPVPLIIRICRAINTWAKKKSMISHRSPPVEIV